MKTTFAILTILFTFSLITFAQTPASGNDDLTNSVFTETVQPINIAESPENDDPLYSTGLVFSKNPSIKYDAKFFAFVENDEKYNFVTGRENTEVKTYRYDELNDRLVYVETYFPQPGQITELKHFEKGMFIRFITVEGDGFAPTNNLYWTNIPTWTANK